MSVNDHEIHNAISRAQEGDPQALDFIIGHFGYIVEGVCSRMEIIDAAELSRSDLSQEVWLRVWCKINTFKCCSDPGLVKLTFRSWLRITAKNVILTVIEKRRAQKRGAGQNVADVDPRDLSYDESKTASAIAAKSEELARMEAAIARLPAVEARILFMKFHECKTMHEIAEDTSLTLEQVRYRLDRALRQIEQSLSN